MVVSPLYLQLTITKPNGLFVWSKDPERVFFGKECRLLMICYASERLVVILVRHVIILLRIYFVRTDRRRRSDCTTLPGNIMTKQASMVVVVSFIRHCLCE